MLIGFGFMTEVDSPERASGLPAQASQARFGRRTTRADALGNTTIHGFIHYCEEWPSCSANFFGK
jgi:hypothetical protein